MRIAMLCVSQPRVDDEGWSREPPVIPLSRSLRQAGHQVHIFLPSGATQSGYKMIEGLDYHYVVTRDENPSPRELARAMLYYMLTTQEVAGPFDVAHAHDPLLCDALAEAHARLRLNTVLSLWTEEQVRRCAEIAGNPAWRIGEILGAAVCPSQPVQHVAMSALDLPGDRIVLRYPGVSLTGWGRSVDQGKFKRELGFGPFDPLLLCAGEFDQPGSAWKTLEAVFAVRESHPSFRVVFVGDGPLFPYLRDRGRVLGLDGAARFLRYLPHAQLVQLYNACDIVQLPSGNPPDARGIVEAWCAGKPTLISDSAVPEFYEPGLDGLIAPASIEGLVQTLIRLIDDRQAALELGRAGWQKAKNMFAWDTLASQMERLYAGAAPNTTRRRSENVAV